MLAISKFLGGDEIKIILLPIKKGSQLPKTFVTGPVGQGVYEI